MKLKRSRILANQKKQIASLLVIVFVGLSSQSATGADLIPNQQSSIDQWVADLGSPSFKTRRRATRMLIEAGQSALNSIVAGMQSEDPEVRLRSTLVLTLMARDDEAIFNLLIEDSKSKTSSASQSRRIIESAVVQAAQRPRIQKRLPILVDDGRRALKEGDYQSADDIMNQIDQLTTAINLYKPLSPWKVRPGWKELARKVALFEISVKSRSELNPQLHNLAAKELLTAARQNLVAGQLEAARIKAEKAAALDATYQLFDDRPNLVLTAIQRARAHLTLL